MGADGHRCERSKSLVLQILSCNVTPNQVVFQSPSNMFLCSRCGSLLSAQQSLNIFTPSHHAQTLDPLLREDCPWCIENIIQCVLHTCILVSRKNRDAAWSIEYSKQVTCCQSAHFYYISLLYLHLVQFLWKKIYICTPKTGLHVPKYFQRLSLSCCEARPWFATLGELRANGIWKLSGNSIESMEFVESGDFRWSHHMTFRRVKQGMSSSTCGRCYSASICDRRV